MSLKKDVMCPHCGGQVVLRVEKMKRARHEPLPVLASDSFLNADELGHFEAFICKGCGFTEWYARDIEQVRSNKHYGVEVLDRRAGPVRR